MTLEGMDEEEAEGVEGLAWALESAEVRTEEAMPSSVAEAKMEVMDAVMELITSSGTLVTSPRMPVVVLASWAMAEAAKRVTRRLKRMVAVVVEVNEMVKTLDQVGGIEG